MLLHVERETRTHLHTHTCRHTDYLILTRVLTDFGGERARIGWLEGEKERFAQGKRVFVNFCACVRAPRVDDWIRLGSAKNKTRNGDNNP